MTDYPFNWDLECTDKRHKKRNCPISEFKINAQWDLVCLWTHHEPHLPEFLEIRRSSTSKDILVSGSFKMMDDYKCDFKRKFVQLIEAGYDTMLIELDTSYFDDDYEPYYSPDFTITGTISIPARLENIKYDSGVKFETFLALSNDFESLLDPGATDFSDVSLNCGAVSLPAHKNILSARSPVFSAMFTTQMKEKQENKVIITDISPQVIKTMLSYMYTGKTGELCFEIAGELLFAADKYQIQDLKKDCSNYLKSCLSVKNVLKILVLGYLHEKDLEVFAMDFLCNCCREFEVLEKTMEWKDLREKRPVLVMDALTSLVKSKDKKIKSAKK